MLVVPFGRRRLLGVVVDLAEESELPPERLARPLAALEADIPESLVELGLWVAREYVSTPARGLALVLPPGTGTGSARPLVPRRALRATLSAAGRDALGSEAGLGTRQRAVLEVLEGGPEMASAVARSARAGHSTLRSLERRGLVALDSAAEPPRRPRVERIGRCTAEVSLTAAQTEVLAAVVARLPGGGPTLLHGVTGSGKTEVYLRAVAAALERGRSAIVLVPEIALTPQTAGRFVDRFGDAVAVMHSRLSARERYDEWWRMRRGEARVCVGPRSAVFAPLRRPGADRDRRGARRLLQAGGRPALRRARGGRAARRTGGGVPAGRQRHAPPRDAGPLRAARAARARGRPAPPAGGDRGDGGHRRAPARAHARGARRRAPAGREGDRAAQPARVVELHVLPALRTGLGVPELRRHAGLSSGGGRGGLPPLRPSRARARRSARTARRFRSRGTARAPSSWSASSRRWSARCPCSGSTPTLPRPTV